MNDLHKVGAYVKNVDPAMYRRIVSIVGRDTEAVGAYVEMADPEMFDSIVVLVQRSRSLRAVTA